MGEADEPAVVRRAARERQADDWALALASAGISCRIGRDESGDFELAVAGGERDRALSVLDAFDAENVPAPAEPLPVEWGPSAAGLALAVFLLVAFRLTGRGWETRAASLGAADATRMLGGEWWRAITALTLHADLGHVLGNAAAAWVLVGAVARRLGPGVALLLTLASGALGNGLTAWVHRAGHLSIGASTATFGALGLLAGLAVVSRRAGVPRTRRALVVGGATLALLGMTGVSEHADVFAHLFGLLVGVALGALVALIRRPPGRAVQALLSAVALAGLGLAWLNAFGKI
jgi:membrane associated rhomboid family serine protease